MLPPAFGKVSKRTKTPQFSIVLCGIVGYPDLPRPFRVPALPLVAGTAIVSSLALMATLPGDTWIRLGVWAALGLCVYFLYARAHSKERMDTIAAGIVGTPEPAPEES